MLSNHSAPESTNLFPPLTMTGHPFDPGQRCYTDIFLTQISARISWLLNTH